MLAHNYQCLFEGTDSKDKLIGILLDDLAPKEWNES
jgi:hypothetical protein